MSKVKNDNFYQISGWMINDLKLKGTELLVYAIIYGFSQDGKSEFTGSLQYLSDFTGATRRTIIYTLASLVDKKLISKDNYTVNGVTFTKYKATECNNFVGSEIFSPPTKNFHGGGEKIFTGVVKKLHGGGEKIAPNNIIYNKYIYNKYKRESALGKHGNVIMTDQELEQLKERYPDIYQERIQRLDDYLYQHPQKHYAHHFDKIIELTETDAADPETERAKAYDIVGDDNEWLMKGGATLEEV